jgi:hypothetical protein
MTMVPQVWGEGSPEGLIFRDAQGDAHGMSRCARLALLCVVILVWSGLDSLSAQESGPMEPTPSPSLSPVQVSTPNSPVSTPRAGPDQASTAQLREAFRQVTGLQTITLEVRGGVAVLRGEVSSFQ